MRRSDLDRLEAAVREANPVAQPRDLVDSDESIAVMLLTRQGRHGMITTPTREPLEAIRRLRQPWYRRPVTVFAAAVAVIFVVMVPVLLVPLWGDAGPTGSDPVLESSITTATASAPTTALSPIAPLGDESPQWVETRLSASDGKASVDPLAGDWYGYDVAVDGDRIVIGSPTKYEGITYGGAVYVYEPDGNGGWVETKLTASDGANAGQFGMSVAVDGDIVVVGRPFELDSEGLPRSSQGAAYVYEPDGNGGWAETKLTASDGAPLDEFGSSVAVSGDRIVVGAGGDDEYSGAVYVFEPDGTGGWVETKLTASDRDPRDNFGFRASLGLGMPVAVDGDRIAAGSRSAVYLFEADGTGEWVETRFEVSGYGVAIDGDRIVIGVKTTVYAYEPDGTGGWAATDLDIPERGRWLDASDGRIVIVVDGTSDSPGRVYVLESNSDGEWIETVLTVSDSNTMDDNSWSYHDWVVAVDGDRVVVGAPYVSATGAGYVYENIKG